MQEGIAQGCPSLSLSYRHAKVRKDIQKKKFNGIYWAFHAGGCAKRLLPFPKEDATFFGKGRIHYFAMPNSCPAAFAEILPKCRASISCYDERQVRPKRADT
ncbi:MAG TPA: hypothetical protein DDZ04_06890 [Parabacteroides sp.]|nr:hypothetical protein [Parabacteroides sp.]